MQHFTLWLERSNRRSLAEILRKMEISTEAENFPVKKHQEDPARIGTVDKGAQR